MLAYAGYLSPLSAEERSSSFSKASANTLSRQRLVSEVVLRDALSCYAWYKTRLHSLRPMCKRIGLTSTMWSIKMRSLSMLCDNEAVAEKQPRIVLSIICQLQKKDKDSSKRCFSPAVDAIGHLKI